MREARILVVEDESIVGLELKLRLEELGYSVLAVVGTGKDAIEKAAELNPDLLLTDINLAGDMDGIEAARQIRECRDLPVVYLTAYADADTLQRAMGPGPYGYIVKPFPPMELSANIEVALHRWRLERVLKESEEQYRLLADNVADVICCLDRDMCLTYASPSVQRLLGFAPAELLSTQFDALVSPGSSDQMRSELTELLLRSEKEDEPASRAVEIELRRRDGSSVWTEIRFSPLADSTGRCTSIIAVARDITERRRLQAQLLESQRIEAMARLAAGSAHGFNNLLTGIMGYGYLLLESAGLTSEQRADAEKIISSAERAASLAQQLLAFGGKQVLRPWIRNLNSIILDSESTLRAALPADVELIVDLEPKLAEATVDASQMAQMLATLVLNARDALPHGGKINIWTANIVFPEKPVGDCDRPGPGPYVMLGVRDDGIGMDEQTKSRIFEPFFTTKGVAAGQGMGLAVARGFVGQSGGHISVESKVGSGTTLRIYFPQAQGIAHAQQHLERNTLADVAPTAISQPRTSSASVLVVDDNKFVEKAVCEILKRSGLNVIGADGPDQALDVCNRHQGRIDLLLTDLVMPRMNGYTLAKRMTELRPEIKVLFMSGHGSDILRSYGAAATDVPYIRKPFAPDDLEKKVREMLGERG